MQRQRPDPVGMQDRVLRGRPGTLRIAYQRDLVEAKRIHDIGEMLHAAHQSIGHRRIRIGQTKTADRVRRDAARSRSRG